MHRVRLTLLAAPLCALLAAAGCKQPAAPTPDASSAPSMAATEAPDAKPGITLSNVRIVLPPVAGNPAALYFTVRNGAGKPATLVAIAVTGAAEAQMHETIGGAMKPLTRLAVPANGSAEFAPGGKHVMVFGVPGKLKPSAMPEVTLTFADGDKITAKAAVQATGAAAMPGMTM